MRKNIRYSIAGSVLFIAAVICCGCEKQETDRQLVLPAYEDLLQEHEEAAERMEDMERRISISVYEVSSETMRQWHKEDSYSRLIEALNDLANIYPVNDYTENLISCSVLDLFEEEERISLSEISVILAELPENMEDQASLARQIKKRCGLYGLETVLFGFPEDKKVYFMLLTGPKEYVGACIENMKECLETERMTENISYFLERAYTEWNRTAISAADVIIVPSAEYHKLKEEIDAGGSRLPRNMDIEEDARRLFREKPEVRPVVFRYEKTEGLSKKYKDWRLEFYLPLNDSENERLQYEMEIHFYRTMTSGADMAWVREDGLGEYLNQEIDRIRNYPGKKNGFPEAYRVRLHGDSGKEAPEQQILLLITIKREETLRYTAPEWAEGVMPFCNLLFGEMGRYEKSGTITRETVYAEIPVILTGLKK